MGKTNPRRVALDCLRTWEGAPIRRHADEILRDLSGRAHLSGPDHALALNLFYGVLRHQTRLDALIDELRHGNLNPEIRRVLRLGMFQLYHTEIPEHAAVNETVALAQGLRGVVNGILRNAQRRRPELEELANSWPLPISQSHPAFLVGRWEKQFGADAARKICEWNNEPPPVYARVNRLIEAAEETVAQSSLAAKVRGQSGFFRITEGAPPADWLEDGLIYIQDPSTALACDLLAPRRHETILDACAAPGGKTALLADRMRNEGRIIATDADRERLPRLEQNLKRLRVRIADCQEIDWLRPPKPKVQRLPKFDAILIDAPCSNTGVMRRRIDVRWRLRPDEFGALQGQQVSIAAACIPLLRPGGRLIYSTCSLEPEENQGVLDQLLKRFPGRLELEDTAVSLPWRDGFDGAFAARLRLKKSG